MTIMWIGLSASANPAKTRNPLSRFSLNLEKMRTFTERCVKVPTEEEMEKELLEWSERERSKGAPFLSLMLDGFPLTKVSETEFIALRTLTIHRGAHGPYKDQYRFKIKNESDQIMIQRTCVSEACKARGADKAFDLSPFAKTDAPACSDALCGVKRIFGDTKGLLILWAYSKWGTNLSPYSDLMADPQGLDTETMKAILAASLLTPDHLKSVALRGTGFFRYLKGMSLPFYKGQRVVANSYGGVFDPIDELKFPEKVYFFIHELAHRARLVARPALDESEEWMKVSGWKDKTPPSADVLVSSYAKVNPFEDFAETYTLYRLDPIRLKAVSLDRYEFMKEKVFDGLEYVEDPCVGSRPSPLQAAR